MNFNFITENWYVILFAIIACVAGGILIYKFAKAPKETQIKILKEWLRYAVSIAESELGSGTGQLKLRFVYDMFISKFPNLAKVIPFDVFGGYVDEALEWMNSQIDTNKSIKVLITGELEDKEDLA